MTVVAQTSYYVGAFYFDRKQSSYFRCVVILDDFVGARLHELHSFVSVAIGMSHHELNQTAVSYSSQFLTK